MTTVAASRAFVFSACIAFGLARGLHGQRPGATDGAHSHESSALIRSAESARRVVLDAIDAIGGMDALRKLRSLSVERPFTRTTSAQGLKPGVPGRGSGVDVLDMDLARGRYRTLRDMEIDGGQLFSPATIVTPNGGWLLNYANHVVINASATTMLATRADLLRREVPTLLLSALRRSTTLRLLPSERAGERLVTFADVDGSEVGIVFDAATHLPLRTEVVTDDPQSGDVTTINRFSDYRKIPGGLRLPATVTQQTGASRLDMTLGAVRVDQIDDSVFVVPKSFEPAGPSPSPLIAPGVVSLGPGVAIEFNDFVLVFETYGDSRWSEPSLARIRSMIPNKPIRYVVLSHYHGDHIGGIRDFAATGASIITVPDAVAPIRNVLTREHNLTPDSLSVHPHQTSIETVTRERVIEDSTRRLELYEVGPTAHVEQILIGYLPKERILIEGDLLDMPNVRPAAGGDDTVQLEEAIRRLNLHPEKIVPIHGEPETMAELQAAIRMHDARLHCSQKLLERLSCPFQDAAKR